MSESKKVIEFQKLACKVGHNYLLNNINWEVKQGEHWAIYGMNGCGKTTLLSIIAGFKHYTAGSLKVFEEEYNNQNALNIRKKIGFISSSFFDKKYTKEGVLDIVLSAKSGVLGRDYDTTLDDILYVKELLSALHIENKINKQFDMLSKGERQSVLIARALFNEPELLILDEPCNGLDIYKRECLFSLLNELAKTKNITMLYVTQHIEEIGDVFTHTLLLRNGYIFDKGPTEEMFTSEKISSFLGYDVEIKHDENNKRKIQLNIDTVTCSIPSRKKEGEYGTKYND